MTKKTFFFYQGIIAEFFMSVTFFLTSIMVENLALCYTPLNNLITYKSQLTGLVAVVIFLIIRRINIPKSIIIPAHILFLFLYCFLLKYFHASDGKLVIGAFLLVAIVNAIFSISRFFNASSVKKGHSYLELFVITIIIQILLCVFFLIGGRPDLIRLTALNIVISICLYAISRQLTVLDDQYSHIVRVQPVRSVKRQNLITVVTIVFTLFLSVVLMIILPSKKILTAIVYAIGMFLRFILSPLFKMKDDYYTPIDEPIMEELPEEEFDYGPTPVIDLLATIAIVLIIIAIFIIFFLKIRNLIGNFRREEYISSPDGSPVSDIIESVKKDRKSFFSRQYDFGHGEEYKVRKKYFKTVTKAIKGGAPVKDSSSPNEIREIMEGSEKHFGPLSDAYEDIRYNRKKFD